MCNLNDVKKIMKTKYLLPVLALAFTAFGLSSCEDMLETHYQGGTQDSQQIQETIDAIPSRLNSTVTGMYALLKEPISALGVSSYHNDFGYPSVALIQDLNGPDMTNEVSNYDWFSPCHEWSDRDPGYIIPAIRLTLFYKVLYAANNVLASIAPDTEDEGLIASRGQAKAMRAFSYLSLVPYFQFSWATNNTAPSVPIQDFTLDARNNPRAPLNEVYAYIVKDLNEAIADFNRVDFKRDNKGVIDKNVAFGLRARANLYMNNWSAAAEDADSALVGYTPYTYAEIEANPRFSNANDHSWIWGLIIPQDLVGGTIISWPSHLSSFTASGYVPYAGIYRQINRLLWNKIPTTDVRRAWWTDDNNYSPYFKDLTWIDEQEGIAYTDSAIAGATIAEIKLPFDTLTNVKFMGQAGPGGATNEGDWCMMRAEEMILIKAEALAKAGDEAAGKAVLKTLMDERNPQYTQLCEKFEDEVWMQRRIELWGEGFSMSDIMRLGKPVVRYHAGVETNVPEAYQFNIAYGDPWMLLRFTTKEVNNNNAMVNNEGGVQPKQGDGAGLLDGVTD